MRDLIDVKGASGAVYRFTLFRDGRPLSPMGGNFLYVREVGDGFEIVYSGQGQNLLIDSHVPWDEAVAKHGPIHLFTRLNITERTREAEDADIIAAAHPPMNPPAAKAD